jgi:hypothetical protein
MDSSLSRLYINQQIIDTECKKCKQYLMLMKKQRIIGIGEHDGINFGQYKRRVISFKSVNLLCSDCGNVIPTYLTKYYKLYCGNEIINPLLTIAPCIFKNSLTACSARMINLEGSYPILLVNNETVICPHLPIIGVENKSQFTFNCGDRSVGLFTEDDDPIISYVMLDNRGFSVDFIIVGSYVFAMDAIVEKNTLYFHSSDIFIKIKYNSIIPEASIVTRADFPSGAVRVFDPQDPYSMKDPNRSNPVDPQRWIGWFK